MFFQIAGDEITSDHFIEFLERLLKGIGRMVFLIIGHLRNAFVPPLEEWLTTRQDKIELLYSPTGKQDSPLVQLKSRKVS